MKIVAVVDERGGLMFNHRRQARDRRLQQHILENVKQTLWINPYTAKLFSEIPDQVHVDEDFLNLAGANDTCWVENVPIMPYLEKVDEVILYHWNRTYPGDFYLDLDLAGWNVTETGEFKGSSHERISWERYRR